MRHGLRLSALVSAAVLALAYVGGCEGLTCYYCTIQPPSGRLNLTAKLCSSFDYSSHFYVECPFSTFCLKKTYEMTLQEGKTVRASERGCAPQKWNDQVFRDGSWHSENHIAGDAYSAGCQLEAGHGLRVPETEYCYCSNRLCNGDTTLTTLGPTLVTVTALLIHYLS